MRPVVRCVLVLYAVVTSATAQPGQPVFDPTLASPTVLSHQALNNGRTLVVFFQPVETADHYECWREAIVTEGYDAGRDQWVTLSEPDTAVVPWNWVGVMYERVPTGIRATIPLLEGAQSNMVGLSACWVAEGVERRSSITWIEVSRDIPTSVRTHTWGGVKQTGSRPVHVSVDDDGSTRR